MNYYPININVTGKTCLVVGGGTVALHKVISLLANGALVDVVSETFTKEFKKLRNKKNINLLYKSFDQAILFQKKYCLVFAATDNYQLHQTISSLCTEHNILCNVVDDPQLCNFIVPAVLIRGPVTVSVSTAGASPYLAKIIRDKIGEHIGKNYGMLAIYLKSLRPVVKDRYPSQSKRKYFWDKFFALDPLNIVETSGIADLEIKAKRLLDE